MLRMTPIGRTGRSQVSGVRLAQQIRHVEDVSRSKVEHLGPTQDKPRADVVGTCEGCASQSTHREGADTHSETRTRKNNTGARARAQTATHTSSESSLNSSKLPSICPERQKKGSQAFPNSASITAGPAKTPEPPGVR